MAHSSTSSDEQEPATMLLTLRYPYNRPGEMFTEVEGVTGFSTEHGSVNTVEVEFADGDTDTFRGNDLTVESASIAGD